MLLLGFLKPSLQSWPCQKHPWTKIAFRLPTKAMSGLPGKSRRCSRYPVRPRSLRIRLTANSGSVSLLRIRRMFSERRSGESLSVTFNLEGRWNLPEGGDSRARACQVPRRCWISQGLFEPLPSKRTTRLHADRATNRRKPTATAGTPWMALVSRLKTYSADARLRTRRGGPPTATLAPIARVYRLLLSTPLVASEMSRDPLGERPEGPNDAAVSVHRMNGMLRRSPGGGGGGGRSRRAKPKKDCLQNFRVRAKIPLHEDDSSGPSARSSAALTAPGPSPCCNLTRRISSSPPAPTHDETPRLSHDCSTLQVGKPCTGRP